jgi:NTP pyrophosphatase (non-canonical NTP hydrolase)
MGGEAMSTTARINALSAWIDDGLAWDDAEGVDRSNEAKLMHRTVKIGEEYGEVVQAIIGATGANPRKGFTHDLADVNKELLDVALTALGAWAHTHGNSGDPMCALVEHIDYVCDRAGVAP